MNDSPVDCQNREVTEPQRDRLQKKALASASAFLMKSPLTRLMKDEVASLMKELK